MQDLNKGVYTKYSTDPKKPQKVKDLANELTIYLQSRNAPMPKRKDTGESVPYPSIITVAE